MSEQRLFTSFDEKVAPRHTAVLCVDVQNEFVVETPYNRALGWDLTAAQQMAERLRAFLDTARQHRVPLVHVRANYDPIHKNEPMRERDYRMGLPHCCLTGTFGFEFYRGFGPRDGELLITKHRYDAFYGTELDVILEGMGIRTLVLGGLVTNGCVDSTARSGYFHGYHVVFLSDGSAAGKESWHQATLETMAKAFGEVRTIAEVEAAWARIAAQAGAPALA